MPPKTDPVRSLDTVLAQVVVDYFDDPNFQWHHRVLLVQLEGPRWIVVTPDGSVQVLDLSEHRVIPVRRHAAFPDSVRGNVYIFDPFEDGEEESYVAQAVTLARIMGMSRLRSVLAVCRAAAGAWPTLPARTSTPRFPASTWWTQRRPWSVTTWVFG